MLKVVFLCKGSRGDVLPLLSVALSYQYVYFHIERYMYSNTVLYTYIPRQGRRENINIVFVCAPSSLDRHIRSTLQDGPHRPIELWDLPEFDIHRPRVRRHHLKQMLHNF